MSNDSDDTSRADASDPSNRQDSQRNRDSRGSSSGGNGQSDDETGSTPVQKGVILLSAAITILLFAYAGWQIAASPVGDTPEVSVVGTQTLDDGSVAVTVRLENPQDVGLVTATVQSSCSSPPVQAQLSYIPASSSRTATLVCPPGTTDPGASIVNWVTR